MKILSSVLATFLVASSAQTLCSEGCSSEFVQACVPYHCRDKSTENAVNQCRSEVNADFSRLKRAGCVPYCIDTAEMAAATCDSFSAAGTTSDSSSAQLEERPNVPTLCNSRNQGACECGTGDVQTYVFWSPSTMQRCVHTTNFPDPTSTSTHIRKKPVLLQSAGYSSGKLNAIKGLTKSAQYYGFAAMTLSSLLNDGAGGFGLEFGNNGIANDTNPTPCSEEDSRDIGYLKSLFTWIEGNAGLDNSKTFTRGFSQESMFAAYVAICFPDKVAGVWQGGSGLAKTGYAPVTPGYQSQCSTSSHDAYGRSCCSSGFCKECQYWPAWPKTCGHKLKHCIMSYTDDAIGCGSDWYMYEATRQEGNDARLLSFPGGQHSDPQNAMSWMVGCLGLAESCSSSCSSEFMVCVQHSTQTTGPSKYRECEQSLALGHMTSCAVGCAPTLAMLSLSERPTVTLSEGNFGTQTGLETHSGSAPRPNCKTPFGKIGQDGVTSRQCPPPSGLVIKDPSPRNICNAPAPTPVAVEVMVQPKPTHKPTVKPTQNYPTFSDCKRWAAAGFCSSNKYVKANCEATCNEVDKDARCYSWRSYCTTNDWVKSNCRQTCSTDEALPSSSSCNADKRPELCRAYRSHCQQGQMYFNWMSKNCETTCCSTKSASTCGNLIDNSPEDLCFKYASHCKSGFLYNPWMQLNCAKTCCSNSS